MVGIKTNALTSSHDELMIFLGEIKLQLKVGSKRVVEKIKKIFASTKKIIVGP